MKLTALEAKSHLYQFNTIPFRFTNSEGAFQRIKTKIVKEDCLVDIYTNDVAVVDNLMEDWTDPSNSFEEAWNKKSVTLNENKTVKGIEQITIMRYEIEREQISPDQTWLQPVMWNQGRPSSVTFGGHPSMGGKNWGDRENSPRKFSQCNRKLSGLFEK